MELLDEDGYPTDEALDWIRKYQGYQKLDDWFAFIKNIWWNADWGWHEEDTKDDIFEKPVKQYQISTGGWSGNESIIAAMQENWIMWSITWVQSRRGGHYIFEVKKCDG